TLTHIMERVAKIGYEGQVKGLLWEETGQVKENTFDREDFDAHRDAYTILDIRNEQEVEKQAIFAEAIHNPLHRLRENTTSIPTDKPIVVHCAGGLRSAIGSRLLALQMPTGQPVDMGETFKQFYKQDRA